MRECALIELHMYLFMCVLFSVIPQRDVAPVHITHILALFQSKGEFEKFPLPPTPFFFCFSVCTPSSHFQAFSSLLLRHSVISIFVGDQLNCSQAFIRFHVCCGHLLIGCFILVYIILLLRVSFNLILLSETSCIGLQLRLGSSIDP